MLNYDDIETILFDLDGTLLPIDVDEFLKIYFQALTEEFTDLAKPERLIQILMQATEAMIETKDNRTNKEVFMESFFSHLDVDNQNQIMERFDNFYQNKYCSIKYNLDLHQKGQELIEQFSNFKLIIATNPLFPRIAITERMTWAGLDPGDFDYITCYEDMHYCKPHLDFYQELVTELDLNPEKCVMIGNDVQEDLVASELGMKTILIEDYLIDRNEGKDYSPDWQGSLDQLIEFVGDKIVV